MLAQEDRLEDQSAVESAFAGAFVLAETLGTIITKG